MDHVTVGSVVIAVVTTVRAWMQCRMYRQRARERRDHLRDLPPGSRVIDLGEHGLVIEVGSRAGRDPSSGAGR